MGMKKEGEFSVYGDVKVPIVDIVCLPRGFPCLRVFGN